jgi:hypothetical protein
MTIGVRTFLLCCLSGSLLGQSVTATATGSISATATTPNATQSLPPGSPLPNGATVSALNLASVLIGIASNPTPSILARYSIAEVSTAIYPSGSSTTAATVLALTSAAPVQALLRVTWTHNYGSADVGTMSAAIDIGNDGSIEWQEPGSEPSPLDVTFAVTLGPTPTLIRTVSSTASSSLLLYIQSCYSQLEITVEPQPRCIASWLSATCGAALGLRDAGSGLMTLTPAIAHNPLNDPVLLVLGTQLQTTTLPFSSPCPLAIAPSADVLAFVGPAPLPSWLLDGTRLIGPFAFYAQVLSLHGGSLLLVSNPLSVSCQ